MLAVWLVTLLMVRPVSLLDSLMEAAARCRFPGSFLRQRELINFYNPDLSGSPNLSACPQ